MKKKKRIKAPKTTPSVSEVKKEEKETAGEVKPKASYPYHEIKNAGDIKL